MRLDDTLVQQAGAHYERGRSTSSPEEGAPHLRILGTHGIPGRHGGFESFAEDLALYLVARGWRVTVYCQEHGSGPIYEQMWHGVRRVVVPVPRTGAASTIQFDWITTRHALTEDGVALVLGYNTAIFSLLYRLRGVRSVMNMDGLEWQRGKYTFLPRAWFYLNEWLGCWLSDALVADHPSIADHLATRGVRHRMTTIAYGARRVTNDDAAPLADFGLTPRGYAFVVARPEPENKILEIVRAFSQRPRPVRLVVLGRYRDDVAYEQAVRAAASDDVLFPGPVYDRRIVDAFRRHAAVYVHGHTVGGTNPALVEALGAGAAVLAHDNRFNRWVAGQSAAYFTDEATCARQFDELLHPLAASRLAEMRLGSERRHADAFVLDERLADYEQMLATWCEVSPRHATSSLRKNTERDTAARA